MTNEPAHRVIVNARTISKNTLSGVQRYTEELLKRLGNRVDVVAPLRTPRASMGHIWEQTTLPRIAGGRLLFSPANTGPLRYARQVVTIHDVTPIDHPEWNRPGFSAWYRFLLPRLVGSARYVVTVSEFSRNRLLDVTGVDPERIITIPIGVSDTFRPMARADRDATLRNMDLPSKDYFLGLGANSPRKNLAGLLRAWEQVLPEVNANLWLVVIGDTDTQAIFAPGDRVSKPPRVHFTGHVPDKVLPALYGSALALVFPSLYEGFGLPPLEAMACGTPVIAGNRTSIPEVVGSAGILVDPTNTAEIARAILGVVREPRVRRDLAAAGLRRAGRFTWDVTARRTWQVLEKALDG